MDRTCLKEALRPWIKTNTWHTRHPADDQRFHRALAGAFARCGCPIPPDGLRDALSELLAEHHPEKEGDYWHDVTENFVQLAEVIGHFVKDTGGPHRA